jgi:hypothetical protein
MIFENLIVSRIVIHEVFKRQNDRSRVEPQYSDVIEQFPPEPLRQFRLRILDALAGENRNLNMNIAKHNANSFVSYAASMIDSSDADFISQSKLLASKLADEQKSQRIPGGILVVFDGTVGSPPVPFVAALKAETQGGFRRTQSGRRALVEFFNNIFLTPATRLYKIGIMIRSEAGRSLPVGWEAFIFDSNISVLDREAAAAYFYDGFLGCSFPSDGPYETARFYELAKSFVSESSIDPQSKRGMLDCLYVYINEERAPTFSVGEFADRYVPFELQDAFTGYMSSKRFTLNAVVRDVSRLRGRVRKRRLRFGTDIELSASPATFSEKVEIEPLEIQGDGGQVRRWTKILIKEQLTGEK